MSSKNKEIDTEQNIKPELPPDYDPSVPSRERIMAYLRTIDSPISNADLAQALNTEYPLSIGFERRLSAMERDGQLFFNKKGLLLINTHLDFIAGKVQGHKDGFGFFIPDDNSEDLFLAPHEMLKVLHGDQVLVRKVGNQRGKEQATIVEVIKRSTEKLVGRLVKEHSNYIVIPDDQRIKHDIIVPKKHTNKAKNGQIVCIEITQQPTRHTKPTGNVIEILGEVDDPGMEIEIAVRKYDVPHIFSKKCLAQADKIPDHVLDKELKNRVDLRDIPFITIDGQDAKDFDDAVYCVAVNAGTEKNPVPGWRLLVAISDVSHYVSPNDAIDKDAILRGTSVYFPRRVIPMLPESLSNGICSLNPYVDRLVMVCDMVVPASGAKAGQVKAYQFYEAVIRSYARTTYDDVWSMLQQPEGPIAKKFAQFLPLVNELHDLYLALDTQRHKRGAIEFDTIETKIITDDMGKIDRIEPEIRNDAHKIIEECMLAANTSASDFIQRKKRNCLFRVHEGPTTTKLQAFRQFLRSLGLHLDGGEDPTPQDFKNLLDRTRERADFNIIQMMCLRSLQQAVYTPEQSGHFGLAYDSYAHFTAPIRRYPDLLVHRTIKAILNSKKYTPDVPSFNINTDLPKKEQQHEIWEKLGLVLSAAERRAEEASRDVESWLKCWFMKEHVGETFSAHITSVTSFGLFVTLDTLYVEGLVHISELGSDYFIFNEASHQLSGERTGITYKLTDTVHVQLVRVDLEARKIDFSLVKGDTFKDLTSQRTPSRHRYKKAASAKPAALKGTTASERRAMEKAATKQAAMEQKEKKRNTRSSKKSSAKSTKSSSKHKK